MLRESMKLHWKNQKKEKGKQNLHNLLDFMLSKVRDKALSFPREMTLKGGFLLPSWPKAL